jgi:hypothetical protein
MSCRSALILNAEINRYVSSTRFTGVVGRFGWGKPEMEVGYCTSNTPVSILVPFVVFYNTRTKRKE